MKSVYIRLDGVRKINDFVNMLQKCPGEFDLKSGRYLVDAKSILGVFSLDTTGLLELVIHEEDSFSMEKLKPYMD